MRKFLISAALTLPALFASAQFPSPAKSYVNYTAEPATIPANKPAKVDLHFRVLDGYHMNSHHPSSELYIPTNLKFDADPAFKPITVDYPAGHLFSFSFDPKEKLDVYSGDITLKANLTAKPGTYALKGILSYQACDNASCYPPKKLPIELQVTAK